MGITERFVLAAPLLDDRHLMWLTNCELDDLFRENPLGPLDGHQPPGTRCRGVAAATAHGRPGRTAACMCFLPNIRALRF